MNSFIKIVILSFLLCISTDYQLIRLNGVPELFTTDKLGNCYVYRNNLLIKMTSEGKNVGQFTSYDSGTLYSIDASDPMQILLFFKDFNQIVILDSKLNPIGNPLYLDKIGFSSVSAVCKSKQFAIWFYDEFENKLIHYGFNPKGIIQTFNFDKYGKRLSSVHFMIESGGEIYLKDNEQHIWVFDQYGGVLNELEVKAGSNYQIFNKSIVFHNKHKLFNYNFNENTLDSLEIPGFSKFDNLRIENRQIYVLNSDSICILPYSDKNQDEFKN
jgi:hypothetical protein